jgi:hypothetical protein
MKMAMIGPSETKKITINADIQVLPKYQSCFYYSATKYN